MLSPAAVGASRQMSRCFDKCSPYCPGSPPKLRRGPGAGEQGGRAAGGWQVWPAARAIVRTACRVIFQGPNAVLRTTTVHGEDLGAFVVGGEGGGGLLSPSLFAGCEGIVGLCNIVLRLLLYGIPLQAPEEERKWCVELDS